VSCSENVRGGVLEHSLTNITLFLAVRICPINSPCVPFYSHQSIGLMGLCLIILSPLICDPELPIGHLSPVRPRVKRECSLSVSGAWGRDALLIHTIYVALSEGVPGWLVRLEQSNQRWLKTCRAGWSDLNNQTSVDWRRAELAGPVWTIKPALTEDVLSWLVRFDQSNQRWLKTCWAGWSGLTNENGVIYQCQSTVHQASSLLRRRRLFPARSISVRIRISPQSTKRQAC